MILPGLCSEALAAVVPISPPCQGRRDPEEKADADRLNCGNERDPSGEEHPTENVSPQIVGAEQMIAGARRGKNVSEIGLVGIERGKKWREDRRQDDEDEDRGRDHRDLLTQ